jgi:hypothetical protein
MNKPSKIKINVLKILKEHLFKGQKGTYLDCAIWPNKNGTGEYGDTHYITQEISKEARDRGERGAIIGSITWIDEPKAAPVPRSSPPRQTPPDDPDARGDDVPF